MTDKQLSPAESLRLIEAMIQRSGKRLERDSWFPCLLWGYLTVAASLLVYFLYPTLGHKANIFWLIIPIVGWSGMYLKGYMSSKPRQATVTTPLDRFIKIIWLVLGINSLICSFLIGGDRILFLMLLMMGMGGMMTGLATRFHLLTYMSLVGIVMGYGMLFIPFEGHGIILYFGLAFFLTFVIPGHILRIKVKRQEAQSNGDA